MKNKINIYFQRTILTIAIVSLLTTFGCKDEGETFYHYIKVSTSSFTFDAYGNEDLQIKIEANPAWEPSFSDEWIYEVERSENSLTIAVKEYTEKTPREGKVTIKAGEASETVTIRQLEEGAGRYRKPTDFYSFAMSPQGKYIATVIQDINEDGIYLYQPVLIEISTDKRTYFPAVKEYEGIIQYNLDILAVSDNGLLIGSTDGNALYMENGEWKAVDTPEQTNQVVVEAVSSDGTIWVGHIFHYDWEVFENNYYLPVKWTHGKYEILPMPEKNSFGKKVTGSVARGCSTDGSIIYGSTWNDDYDPLIWKDEKVSLIGAEWTTSKTEVIRVEDWWGNVSYVEQELISKIMIHAEQNNMSPNGKYLVAHYEKKYAENQEEKKIKYPVIYNLETEELSVIEAISDVAPMTVSDDGIIFLAKPAYDILDGAVLLPGSSNTITTQQWIKQHFDIVVDEDCMIDQIGPGSHTIRGRTFTEAGQVGGIFWNWYITTER